MLNKPAGSYIIQAYQTFKLTEEISKVKVKNILLLLLFSNPFSCNLSSIKIITQNRVKQKPLSIKHRLSKVKYLYASLLLFGVFFNYFEYPNTKTNYHCGTQATAFQKLLQEDVPTSCIPFILQSAYVTKLS